MTFVFLLSYNEDVKRGLLDEIFTYHRSGSCKSSEAY